MYGLVFATDKYNPLNKAELQECLNTLHSNYRHANIHHLNEQTGVLTSFTPSHKVIIKQLPLSEITKLQLRYEVHTGFDIKRMSVRQPCFYAEDFF